MTQTTPGITKNVLKWLAWIRDHDHCAMSLLPTHAGRGSHTHVSLGGYYNRYKKVSIQTHRDALPYLDVRKDINHRWFDVTPNGLALLKREGF